MLVAQSCLALCNPMDCMLPGPVSMGFSRQEYWSGLPFPSPGDLPDPRLNLVSAIQWSKSAICTHVSPPSWASLTPPTCISYPSRSSQSTELSSLCHAADPHDPFTHGTVCMSVLVSHFVPPFPSSPVCTCPLSTSASLFLPWKLVPLYHFSRFHMYALKFEAIQSIILLNCVNLGKVLYLSDSS